MVRILCILLLTFVVSVKVNASDDEVPSVLTPASSSSIILTDYDDDPQDSDDDDDSDDSEDEGASSSSVPWELSLSANISTLKSTYINWVGPASAGRDTACYRETHIAKVCPLGFDYKLGTCWAECPLDYPVECGMQCIRHNDDCTLEMLSKVSSIAQSALSLATFGAYGAFSKMAKGVQIAFCCGKEVANLVKAMSKYVRTVQVSDPQTTTDQLMTKLYQTDNVVFDLPITIMSCLGIKVSAEMKFADRVTNTIELFVKEIATNKEAILASWTAFTTFMKNIALDESLDNLNEMDISSLQSALESNSTCGEDMKRLIDRVWWTVAYLRNDNPRISEDEIRVILSKSNLMHHEIPIVTNNCMEQLINESNEATAYTTRNTLRKTLEGS